MQHRCVSQRGRRAFWVRAGGGRPLHQLLQLESAAEHARSPLYGASQLRLGACCTRWTCRTAGRLAAWPLFLPWTAARHRLAVRTTAGARDHSCTATSLLLSCWSLQLSTAAAAPCCSHMPTSARTPCDMHSSPASPSHRAPARAGTWARTSWPPQRYLREGRRPQHAHQSAAVAAQLAVAHCCRSKDSSAGPATAAAVCRSKASISAAARWHAAAPSSPRHAP